MAVARAAAAAVIKFKKQYPSHSTLLYSKANNPQIQMTLLPLPPYIHTRALNKLEITASAGYRYPFIIRGRAISRNIGAM